MRDHAPRPFAEDHYYIQHLIDVQEKRSADRIYHQNRVKDEREELIADSKLVVVTDFWCDRCQQDFKSQAIREIETDWSNSSQRIAFYRSKCDRGHWCIRLITDRHKDAFYYKSKRLAADRAVHSLDMLQPGDTGFNLLYGKK